MPYDYLQNNSTCFWDNKLSASFTQQAPAPTLAAQVHWGKHHTFSHRPKQGWGHLCTQERMLACLWQCKKGRAEGEEKDMAAQRRFKWRMGRGGLFLLLRLKTRQEPLNCFVKPAEGFSASASWQQMLNFIFCLKLLLNRLQGHVPAEPWCPGFNSQGTAPNSEVWVSYKNVLWIPLGPALHIYCVHLCEEIVCPHSSSFCIICHMLPFSQRENLILIPSTQKHVFNPSDSYFRRSHTSTGRKSTSLQCLASCATGWLTGDLLCCQWEINCSKKAAQITSSCLFG